MIMIALNGVVNCVSLQSDARLRSLRDRLTRRLKPHQSFDAVGHLIADSN